MGVLKKFEQRLEGLVNGTFAKVFKSEVQPVEIAGALQRECDNNASIWNRDRTVVPNDFIVELSPHDHDRLSPYAHQLGTELAGMVREYAQAQRYSFMGPLQVHLERAEDLDTGLYRVRSRTLAAGEAQGQQPPGSYQQPPQPGGYGYPPPGGYGQGPPAPRLRRATVRPRASSPPCPPPRRPSPATRRPSAGTSRARRPPSPAARACPAATVRRRPRARGSRAATGWRSTAAGTR